MAGVEKTERDRQEDFRTTDFFLFQTCRQCCRLHAQSMMQRSRQFKEAHTPSSYVTFPCIPPTLLRQLICVASCKPDVLSHACLSGLQLIIYSVMQTARLSGVITDNTTVSGRDSLRTSIMMESCVFSMFGEILPTQLVAWSLANYCLAAKTHLVS